MLSAVMDEATKAIIAVLLWIRGALWHGMASVYMAMGRYDWTGRRLSP
jgi:hypothetical protein